MTFPDEPTTPDSPDAVVGDVSKGPHDVSEARNQPGPKRWGVEPDWSKLPATPPRRKPVDVPEWGASSLDARNLAGTSPADAPGDVAPAWQTAGFQEMTTPAAAPLVPEPAALAGPGPAAASGLDPSTSRAPENPAPQEPQETPELQGQNQSETDMAHRKSTLADLEDLPFWIEEPDDYQNDQHGDRQPGGDQFSAPFNQQVSGPAAEFPGDQMPAEPVPAASARAAQPPAAPHALGGAGSGEELRAQAEAILRRLVGRDDALLRDDQWQAIEALVAQARRVLVVQRTGWGKSAVYFVATALLRASGAGPTIIVSPLLALMRDQIAAAARAGVRAVTINSANVTEWDSIHAQIAQGEVDVLLCSPERLNNPDFRDQVLPRLAASAGLVVIDEAHCISDWGHDFRPDYRRIRTLIEDLPAGIPVLATTATANERVTLDVAEQLAVGNPSQTADDGESVLVLRGALDRESLHLAVLPVTDQPTRVAWLIDALRAFQGSGIVYCLTVAAAEQVAEQLRSNGLTVAAYTGRTDPAERESLEADLKENRVKALIATSALGMGFDKPDLSFVIHLGAPSSPIAYYQQVGRAGRGVAQATVVLVPGVEDQQIWDYFGSLGFPAEQQVRAVLDALAAGGTQSVARLETQVDLRRSRLEMMLKVLDVDDVVRRVRGGWESTGNPWAYDGKRYERVAQSRMDEQRTMLDYEATTGCRMAFLRRTLDDPALSPSWQCGRCDRCSTVALPPLPDSRAVNAARSEMDRPGDEVSVRRMWPSGMSTLGVDLSGKIPASELAEPGRAIGRLDGLGWSAPLRDLFAPSTPDGQVPVSLRTAAARVLDDWDQRASIDGVVWIGSAIRPILVEHLATGLGKYLGKPVVGSIQPRPGQEPGRHDINSAMRLASVAKRLDLNLSEAAAAGLPGRTILLIDDFTDSGWTLTVAARLLRLAGAGRVLPFVLAIR